ncbi:DNA-binding protein HU-beta [Nocardioides terrae]|uniref:DNA-binding protein HU-beta n=1 Tax=Nocardioides terrae TaxID=574651 RepID=A0A1I1IZK3_9ACTN|nr:HU family DNA-binding protein [Nocardioides terrae]SFC41694.1 DNA-binding protein HU-beta [Nocardioides terrae]
MNKSQLVDALAARFDGNKKAAAHALESVLDTITREVARGEKVAITGFGSFEKRVRPARLVRNPRTGEQIKTKKTFVPKFNAGADLKNVVSGVKKLPKLSLPSLPGKRAAAARSTGAAPAKVAASKPAPVKQTTAAKKTTTTKSAPSKKVTEKSTAAKAPAKSTAAKTSTTKSTAAKKTSTTKAAPAKTSTTTSAAAKTATKSSAAKKAPAKKTATRSAAKKTS